MADGVLLPGLLLWSLATIQQYHIPVKIVVLRNNYLGMVREYQHYSATGSGWRGVSRSSPAACFRISMGSLPCGLQPWLSKNWFCWWR